VSRADLPAIRLAGLIPSMSLLIAKKMMVGYKKIH
jgi:hypothetical protein